MWMPTSGERSRLYDKLLVGKPHAEQAVQEEGALIQDRAGREGVLSRRDGARRLDLGRDKGLVAMGLVFEYPHFCRDVVGKGCITVEVVLGDVEQDRRGRPEGLYRLELKAAYLDDQQVGLTVRSAHNWRGARLYCRRQRHCAMPHRKDGRGAWWWSSCRSCP